LPDVAGGLHDALRQRSARSVTNRLRHDEAWRIAADETGWSSAQIDCVLDRIAFAQAQCRIEKVTA
jgi:hypothetical protein